MRSKQGRILAIAGLTVVLVGLLVVFKYLGFLARTAEGLARALDAPRDPAAARALARPHDWDALAARMVGEIERRVADRAGSRPAAS